jgi:hypothetical protein
LSIGALTALGLGGLLLATILYVPWLFLMRSVAIRQIRSGVMPPATARALLERLSSGLLILAAGNVFTSTAFLHPDIVAPPLVATLAFPVACIAAGAAAAMLALTKKL